MPENIATENNNKRQSSDDVTISEKHAKKSKVPIISQEEFKNWVTIQYKDFFACTRSMAILAFYLENKLRNESYFLSRECLTNAFSALSEGISVSALHKNKQEPQKVAM